MTYDELKTEFLRRVNLLKLTDMTALNRKCAEILGKIVSENVFEIDDISGACKKILREYYEIMNETNACLQKEIDKKIGLQIAAQKADFPAERVAKVAKALTDPTVPPETIQRRARNAVENVAKSFYDNYVKANAEFRSKAGIKCYIVREASGDCCEWCSSLAGRYVYGEEPDDVYHRHNNCPCRTTFENGRERQNVWDHNEKWQVTPILKIPYEPLVLDKNQAQTLQNIQLAKYKNLGNGLTFNENSGTIESGIYFGNLTEKFSKIKNIVANTFTPEKHKKVSQEYLDSLPKLHESETLLKSLKATNPNNYTTNCQRCVPAYEMRRRGYNVIATDAPKDDTIGLYDFRNVFSNANWKTCNGSGKREITEFLSNSENGTRLEISIITRKGSHLFCAEKAEGKIIFIDPQSGDIDVERYFDYELMDNTSFCRIDNLDLSNLIKDCIEAGE